MAEPEASKKPDPNTEVLQAIAELKTEILLEIEGLRSLIVYIGAKMALDLSKLQAQDAALGTAVTALATTIQSEAVTIQAAIDALNAVSTDPATQAAIDAVTGDLTNSVANLTGSISAVQGLPTAPTPPPASARKR